MAGESIIVSGIFTQPATAVNQIVPMVFAPDWVRVWNTSVAAAPANNRAFYYEWQDAFGLNAGMRTAYTGAQPAIQTTFVNPIGILFVDTQNFPVGGAPSIGTTVTNAAPPVLTVASTASFTTGTVRITQISPGVVNGVMQFSGIDWDITVINGTTFSLNNASAPAAFGPTANMFLATPIPGPSTSGGFYPRNRYISNISNAAQAIVTFTVEHDYQVGETLRFSNLPAIPYGMSQISGLSGTVVAVGQADANGYTNTVTVTINTNAFTPFTFPTSAQAAALNYQYAQVVPYGEDTGTIAQLNGLIPPFGGLPVLGDSLHDTSFTGIIFQAAPTNARLLAGGFANDTIVWQAGTGPRIS